MSILTIEMLENAVIRLDVFNNNPLKMPYINWIHWLRYKESEIKDRYISYDIDTQEILVFSYAPVDTSSLDVAREFISRYFSEIGIVR